MILTGTSSDLCVLFTASDAHMRDLVLFVPEDCTVAATSDDHERALELIRRKFDADTTRSKDLDLQALIDRRPIESWM